MNNKEAYYSEVFFALGSNLGNKIENLNRTLLEIEQKIGTIKKKSAWHFSKALGFESDNDFVNCVVRVFTKLNSDQILLAIEEIEQKIGREKKSILGKYEDRIIDIDILYIDQEIISKKNLKVPHPHIYKRDFVYLPLLEIAADKIDPKRKKNVKELVLKLIEKNKK